MGIGAMLLAFISQATGMGVIIAGLIVVGVGLGLNTAPVDGVAVAALPASRSGTASGTVNTSRMVGATLGVAVLGTVFAAYAGQEVQMGAGFLAGLHAAMSGSAAAELLGATIALTFIRKDSLRATA
jgi:MFS transporter, DHA2 family, methylenomycin A resistance protein